MFYLIGQIAVTLLFTALIGITMGWLLRGLGTSRQLESIEARWRARVAQLERRSDDAAVAAKSTEVVTAGDPATDEKTRRRISELQKQIRQRDELLASLHSAKRPQSNANDVATRLQETTELSDQLQQHVVEQTSAIEQLRARVKKLNSEHKILVDRLRDRESEIGRMSQERQHAINTIASLQKEMRTMRGEQRMAAAASTSAKAPATPRQAGPAISKPQTDRAAGTTGHEARPAAQQSTGDTTGPATPRHARPAISKPQTDRAAGTTGREARPAAQQSTGDTTGPATRQAGAAISKPQTDRAAGTTGHEARPAAQQTDGDTTGPAPATARTPVSRPAPERSEPVVQQDLPIADGPEKGSASQYEPTWRLSAPQGQKDNLQAIFGIGPKLEMQLNKLGVFHFEQIGRFESIDILWVAHHLKSFPGRIVRDRWIEQAQTLANQRRG